VLGAIGKNDSAAAKALIKAATNDPDANVRATALDFLLRLNPERTRRAERSGKALASLAPSFEAP
jgi:HEAT repeat protein